MIQPQPAPTETPQQRRPDTAQKLANSGPQQQQQQQQHHRQRAKGKGSVGAEDVGSTTTTVLANKLR
jgi:hypothetical protein